MSSATSTQDPESPARSSGDQARVHQLVPKPGPGPIRRLAIDLALGLGLALVLMVLLLCVGGEDRGFIYVDF